MEVWIPGLTLAILITAIAGMLWFEGIYLRDQGAIFHSGKIRVWERALWGIMILLCASAITILILLGKGS